MDKNIPEFASLDTASLDYMRFLTKGRQKVDKNHVFSIEVFQNRIMCTYNDFTGKRIYHLTWALHLTFYSRIHYSRYFPGTYLLQITRAACTCMLRFPANFI